MGAWGTGNFENDMALDWVVMLESANDLTLIKETLSSQPEEGVLDADEGAMMLAAAEVLAAMRGRPSADLPESARAWVLDHADLDPMPLREECLRAIDSVLGEQSELRSLWAAEDESFSAWRASVEDVRDRVAGGHVVG